MKTYAKLESGALRVMGRVPNISNATDAQVAEYAAAHGFKELITTPQPGRFYTNGYEEGESSITEVWTPIPLEAAKKQALSIIQQRRDASMQNAIIPCDALPNGILFNTEAMVYAIGLSAAGSLEGETWTDAADDTHDLTPEMLASIAVAMKSHIKAVQDAARPYRDDIRAAEDVDTVAEILDRVYEVYGNGDAQEI